MLVRPASLLVSVVLALGLAGCGDSSDDPKATTTSTTGGGSATEKQYAAKAEAACARTLATAASARDAGTAMRTERSRAAQQRFFDVYATYFTDSATTLGVLADTPAPASYDAFRAGSRRQDAYLSPIFRDLATRARAATGTADIQAILASVSKAEKGLPSVPDPPAAFARLAPSCAKIAAQ